MTLDRGRLLWRKRLSISKPQSFCISLLAPQTTCWPQLGRNAAWQKITSDWWDTQRSRFSLYTSSVVTEEAGRGNPDAASRRLNALSDIPLLAITEAVVTLSKALLKEGALPAKALDDALHVAIAAIHGVDYLLTWNCRHIDNAEMKPVMRNVCAAHGYACSEICTPQELMGATENG